PYEPWHLHPHPDLHVPQAGWRRGVNDPRNLPWLALAAVGCAPHLPLLASPDGVARPPELRGDPCVVGVPVEPNELAVLDAPGQFATELEVHPLVVDRPRLVRRHEHAVRGVADDLLERPLARHEVDVRHPDEGEVLPTVRPHRPRRARPIT